MTTVVWSAPTTHKAVKALTESGLFAVEARLNGECFIAKPRSEKGSKEVFRATRMKNGRDYLVRHEPSMFQTQTKKAS